MKPMDESEVFAFKSSAEILRNAVAKEIEQLKRFKDTDEYRDDYITIELAFNNIAGKFKDEFEVLKHAEAKNA